MVSHAGYKKFLVQLPKTIFSHNKCTDQTEGKSYAIRNCDNSKELYKETANSNKAKSKFLSKAT